MQPLCMPDPTISTLEIPELYVTLLDTQNFGHNNGHRQGHYDARNDKQNGSSPDLAHIWQRRPLEV